MKSSRSGYVVFEDYVKATGPKVHSADCYYYERWLSNPTTTTTWHGPYKTHKEAWDVCKDLCRGTNFEPKDHDCF